MRSITVLPIIVIVVGVIATSGSRAAPIDQVSAAFAGEGFWREFGVW